MKTPFIDLTLYNNANTENSVINTTSRSSTIIPPFIGKTFGVYNGSTNKKITISENMVYQKLGAFVFTKKLGSSIHNSEHNRKKIAKMKRKITQRKVRKTAIKTPKVKKKVKKK
jgi:small subunit ribosomal protein S19